MKLRTSSLAGTFTGSKETVGVSRDRLPEFLGYLQLSQERVKLRTSNSAGTFSGSIYPDKSPLKVLVKRERGYIQDYPNFWGTPNYLRNGQSYELQIL